MADTKRPFNFSAGPAILPQEVLARAAEAVTALKLDGHRLGAVPWARQRADAPRSFILAYHRAFGRHFWTMGLLELARVVLTFKSGAERKNEWQNVVDAQVERLRAVADEDERLLGGGEGGAKA